MSLQELLIADSVHNRNNIWVEKHRAEETVWDKLAKENPTHAVISAPDEAAAAEKSEAQIKKLNDALVDGVVLDLGCGYGRVAQHLLPKRTFSGYIGLDSSYQMLQLFKSRYEETEAEQATPTLFLNSDIHTIPLKDNSVDNVIVIAVFLHNHKSVTKQALEEVRRVLKPGGKLIVYGSFPNKWTIMGLQGSLYQLYLNLRGTPFKNGPVRYYSRSEVRNMLSDLEILQFESPGFALFPKRIIFFPEALNRLVKFLSNGLNTAGDAILPTFVREWFGAHHDVYAKK